MGISWGLLVAQLEVDFVRMALGRPASSPFIRRERLVGPVGAVAVALGIGVGLAHNAPIAQADDSATPEATQSKIRSETTARSADERRRDPYREVLRSRVNADAVASLSPRITGNGRKPLPVVGQLPETTRLSRVNATGSNRQMRRAARQTRETTTGTVKVFTGSPSDPATLVSVWDGLSVGQTKPMDSLRTCACKVVLGLFQGVTKLLGIGGSTGGPGLPIPRIPLISEIMDAIRRAVEQILAIPVVEEAVWQLKRWVGAQNQKLVACANPPAMLPTDLEKSTVIAGLNQPTDFRFMPDGRIIVTEKQGAIKVFAIDELATTPVTVAVLPTRSESERGLVGIELDPDFTNNGFVYVSYTTAGNHDRLSRFTYHLDSIDLSSEFVLMESPEEAGPMHHGGEIHFGPDGKIYWATGDNAHSTDAQLLNNIHGKILRLNSDGSVPEDNPFVDLDGAIPQIYAYGLRNPFRFTFTPSGALLAGDVGDRAWEELNLVTAGGNYGWPSAEGICLACGYSNPVYSYLHSAPPANAGSITSVVVYDGGGLPEQYRGKVLIADYALGWIKELQFNSNFTSVVAERTLDSYAGTPVKLLQGPDGNLYQLNIYPGVLYRITPAGSNRAPSAILTATPSNGLSPLTVQFSSEGSVDPDPGATLTFNWDFGDGGTSSLANPTRTYGTNGVYNVTLTVSDGGKSSRASQRIVVGSTAPQVQILTPVAESRYNAGDTISFSASASDDEDGQLPDSAYRWTVIFHHADHIHPYADNIAGSTAQIDLSTSDQNVETTWYEFLVTVTDSSGLTASQSVHIRPNLVTLTFTSLQPDATYTIDGMPRQGTHTEQAVVGVIRNLDAISPQTVNGNLLTFNSWSDGGAQQHSISTPITNTTYTVNFDINAV